MASASTFQVVSFGCKVNQVEGEALAARLRELGLREAASDGGAELVIVNTCAVTGEAARQCRQRIRRALRRGARVIVTGCAAHPAAEDAAIQGMPGLLLVEPEKGRVASYLEPAAGAAGDSTYPAASAAGSDVAAAGADVAAAGADVAAAGRSRALLKIQDGCPAACAYCIVPKVRPQVRSTAPEAVIEQVRALAAAGFREFVLCGIHLGLYGADLESRINLADLLERMLSVPGLGRIRLSSIEPMEVSDRLLALMAAAPDHFCPHLHIPLQSGDDGVLERMGRPYAGADFLAVVERIRRALPRPALTTDVLVGFPGETDSAFAETLRVCREAAFSRLHVFPFSKRPGTPAAAMEPAVPRTVIHERRRRAAEVGRALADAYRTSLVGRTAQVVIEKLLPDGSAEGLSERYVRVHVGGPLPAGADRREIVPVALVGIEGDVISGVVRPG